MQKLVEATTYNCHYLMIDSLPKIQKGRIHFYRFLLFSFFQLYYHNNTVEEVRVKYLTSSPIDFNLALKEEINKVKKKKKKVK